MTAGRLLLSALRGRRRDFAGLAVWSVVESLPAFLSGRLVAEAMDEGFAVGRTQTGFFWLGLLAASVVVGAWATRQTFVRLAAVVEPFRDDLARLSVTSALHSSTTPGSAADTSGVARLTRQVEIVREAFASVLMVAQGFLVVTVGALLGVLTLLPAVLLLIVPPLVVGLALFFAALSGMAARQRDSILAEERIAEDATAVTSGLRDVVACGAEPVAAAMVGEHVEAQARATRELARFTAVRTVAVAVGGLLPILLILLTASWLIGKGATIGTLLGALT